MKLKKKVFINSLLIMAFILNLSVIACTSEEGTDEGDEEESQGVLMIITGRVNDTFQLITKEGAYEINFYEKGLELVEEVGRTVKATGYVIEEELEEESVEEVGDKNEEESENEVVIGTITVTSYKVVELF